jgi:hypothetical protein
MLPTVLPLVPFAEQPRKEWFNGKEKKPRLILKNLDRKYKDKYYVENEDDDYYDTDSDEEGKSSGSESPSKGLSPKGGRKFNSRAFYEETYDPEFDEYKKNPQLYQPPIIEPELMSTKSIDSTLAGIENPDFMDNVAYLLANPQLLTTSNAYLKEQPKRRRQFRILSKDFRKKYLRSPVTLFLEWKEAERQRRMHYLFKEYEQRVKDYDDMMKEKARKEIEEDEK